MALINKLTAIADGFRESRGTTDKLSLDQMATLAAEPLQSGGGGDLPEEAFKITGKCSYKFANDSWKWFVDMYGNRITTEGITDINYMFNNTTMEVPFDINITKITEGSVGFAFGGFNGTRLPLVKGDLPVPTGNYSNNPSFSYFIYNCYNIREIPDNYFDNFGGEAFWAARKNFSSGSDNLFASCYSLRRLPNSYKNLINANTSSYNTLYSSFCNNAFALDEILDVPVSTATFTSNCFDGFAKYTCRLQNLTFETNADGSAKTANWKAQTIDLTTCVGYAYGDRYITGYNSGITDEQCVDSCADLSSLKAKIAQYPNDWWTTDLHKSRYDVYSAVNTINSLPDTSAYLAANGGTNTIKFKKNCGNSRGKKDGDVLHAGSGVQRLTTEEIATAAAKGWTVTFVD